LHIQNGSALRQMKPETRALEIYLIEDDEIYAEFIRKSLLGQNADWKIRHFITAEEAEKAINGKLPEVLIIDYKLPGISGIDLYDRIKHKVKENNKVIMLSALDDGQMVLGFIQKGVRDYVIKDENVVDSLKAILDGKEDDFYLFN
jgi:DNA-binding NarL/FixJ family response regulator